MAVNTSANYLGLKLNSPLLVGSCSLTRNPESVREFAIAGAGAVVLPSLFEEQLADRKPETEIPSSGQDTWPEFSSRHELDDEYNGGPEDYLSLISCLKSTIAIPVIASLNGYTNGQWLGICTQIEKAGADVIEVTLEPDIADPDHTADDVEAILLSGLQELCNRVSIPISVKLSPFHTNLCNLAWRIQAAGAVGIVCFAHEPTWQIEPGRICARPTWELTPAGRINPTISGLLRVRHRGPKLSVAASGGISAVKDMVNTLIAGADVVMITSEIYRSGPDVLAHLMDGLVGYLNRHGFESLSELIDSRPKITSCLRSMQSGCLARSNSYSDPTPKSAAQIGDRWGHKH